MATMVVALGGNSLIKDSQKGTFKEQLRNLDNAMGHVAKLILAGHKVVITHGNGPQVGNILLQQHVAIDMPMHVCVAESQGMIGYLIQESLYNKLHGKKDIPVVTVLTQVLVDPKDPAFRKPSKPVGPYYRFPKRQWDMIKTDKGWRRVVPSPKPQRILEAREIKKMTRDAVVVACGGGGIPVIKRKGIKGVDAVIDKDLAGAKLASVVGAKEFIILTDVNGVYLNYRKNGQKLLKKLTLKEAKVLRKQGQFPPGSMGPKIEAVINFLENGGRKAYIAHLDRLEDAMKGKAGTVISR